jgi:hypothetical protein
VSEQTFVFLVLGVGCMVLAAAIYYMFDNKK